MLRRIWRAILTLFRGKRQGTTERDATPGREETVSVPVPPAPVMRRLALLASELKPYGRRMPEVRKMKVDGFTDAYRFWIRLCGQYGFSCTCSAGSVRYVCVLPDQTAVFEFTCKPSAHGRVLAVIRVNAPVHDGQVKEIRFIVTDKKRIEHENNQVRVHRKRSVPA
ncbi:hypothetical protein [Paraprevotella clara]|uniref:hypothetical protein n=1 Tax=Paraprevotella clara TaxID=454154 RepID=UPI003AB57923